MNKSSLTHKILIYMVAAIIIGVLINSFASQVDFIQTYFVQGIFHIGGKMFVEMLKMLVVPIVFCSLILGVVGMDDMKTLGRTGGKTLALFLLTTALAITLALLVAVTLNIGDGFMHDGQQINGFSANAAPSFGEIIIGLIPSNIVGAMAEADMLKIIVACLFLGIAMANTGEAGKAVAHGIERFYQVMMTVVNMVMALAPYGVFCLMAKTFAEQGPDLIIPMAGYFFVVLLVLFLHGIGTYSLMLSLFAIHPLRFLKKMRKVQLFAFSTASSNATIPVTLKNVEERLGVANSTASFTIPFGATINMDGTAIMQGVATVFIANVYNIDLGLIQYLIIIGMAVLASIGTAGVPGVGLVMLTMVFTQVGLPVEGIALIIGVDRLLDMVRTAVNVTGDSAVTCIVAKSENKLDMDIYNNPDAGNEETWHEHAPAHSSDSTEK